MSPSTCLTNVTSDFAVALLLVKRSIPSVINDRPNQKLYLFMRNGNIVEISSDLNINSYSFDLSFFSDEIAFVEYNKSIMLDENNILVNVKIQTINGKKISFIAKISIGSGQPQIEMIKNTSGEYILNVDNDENEFYTKSFVNNKNVISIWDTKSIKIKNKIILSDEDTIYFVDRIK